MKEEEKREKESEWEKFLLLQLKIGTQRGRGGGEDGYRIGIY